MNKALNKVVKSSIISSLGLIVLGALLFFESELTIVSISYIIGGVLVGLGVVAIAKFISNIKKEEDTKLEIIYGITSIILGLLIIINPKAIASVIPFVIGFLIVLSSCVKIQYGFNLKKNKNNMWKSTIIISILTLLVGIFLIFNPFAGVKIVTKLIGILLVIYGILDIVTTIIIRKTTKNLRIALEDNIVEADIIEDGGSEKKGEKKDE